MNILCGGRMIANVVALLAKWNGALDVTSRAPRDEGGSCGCRPF